MLQARPPPTSTRYTRPGSCTPKNSSRSASMLDYALAAAAGVATIASPCILPMLPIVLATTAGRSRAEPLLLIAGFVLSFGLGGILIGALASSSGELQE